MPEMRKKILCIEDDLDTASLIAEELTERGYEVYVGHDGRGGFAAILKFLPDLVLSDISMPVMSGFELLERLTALAPRFRNMPFVFLTALTDRDNELKGRQHGAPCGRRPQRALVKAGRFERARGRNAHLGGAGKNVGGNRANPWIVEAD